MCGIKNIYKNVEYIFAVVCIFIIMNCIHANIYIGDLVVYILCQTGDRVSRCSHTIWENTGILRNDPLLHCCMQGGRDIRFLQRG